MVCAGIFWSGQFCVPGCAGFRILGTGFRITCQCILVSGLVELNYGFQRPAFRTLGRAKIFRIVESGLPDMGRIVSTRMNTAL